MSKGGLSISGGGASNASIFVDIKERFIAACKSGNLQDAEDILQENQDHKKELANSLIEIDAVNASEGLIEVSLLFHAAGLGYVDIVTLLLANDAEINFAAPDTGATPLCIAAAYNHTEVVTALLTANANPDKAPTNGTTPLLVAAQNGHIDVVTALIEAEADLNKARTNYGATPLVVAAERGHANVVTALLKAKANPDIARTDIGATPLFIAAVKGQADVATALLTANANPDIARTDDGTTALMWAAQNSHLDIARLLLNRGADPNQEATDNGATALMWAAQNGHTQNVDILLAYGARSQLRGQLQPLPDKLLQSLTNPAAIFNAQIMYPDTVVTIGTEEARRELDKLKALVTVADDFGIPKLKPYQPGGDYKTYAIHSAQHAFLKARDEELEADKVALATYFNLMNYQEIIGADLTYDILNYKETKDIPSIAEVISTVQQEIVQQGLTHKKGSDEKTGILDMPPEIVTKILDFYASMAPRQEVYRRQNNTLITTINSSLATIFAPDSAEAKIISDTIAKAAEDKLQLPEQVIRSVKESIDGTEDGNTTQSEKGKKSIAGTVQAAVTATLTAPSMSTYTGGGGAAAGVGTRAVETSATTSSATNESAGAAAPYPATAPASTSSSSSATRSDRRAGPATTSPATTPASPITIATESRSTSSTARGL